jgi:hypothetical protein
VFFRQRRHGYNHRLIDVYKFRSMTVAENGDHVVQAKKNDARVTRVGKFLRRTSLDELPQLFNVLKGEMSLVGPRPHAVAHNQHYRERLQRYANRHCVKPGMTGWAQIHGFRGPTEDPEKMRKRVHMDLYYIENWSIWLDLKIIALTPFVGFVHRNATVAPAMPWRHFRLPAGWRLASILCNPLLRRSTGRCGLRTGHWGNGRLGGACEHARVCSGMSLGNARRVS